MEGGKRYVQGKAFCLDVVGIRIGFCWTEKKATLHPNQNSIDQCIENKMMLISIKVSLSLARNAPKQSIFKLINKSTSHLRRLSRMKCW